MKDLFSVPIFFIVFRETLEAAIIISVLLGLVEQIVHDNPISLPPVLQPTAATSLDAEKGSAPPTPITDGNSEIDARDTNDQQKRRLVKKLRFQVRSITVFQRKNSLKDSSLVLDFRGRRYWLIHGRCDRSSIHIRLVHQGLKLVCQVGEVVGRFVLSSLITDVHSDERSRHRHIFTDRISNDIRHGYNNAQNGSR